MVAALFVFALLLLLLVNDLLVDSLLRAQFINEENRSVIENRPEFSGIVSARMTDTECDTLFKHFVSVFWGGASDKLLSEDDAVISREHVLSFFVKIADDFVV